MSANKNAGLGLRILGATGLEATPLCVGTSPLGNTPLPCSRDVPEADAVAAVHRTFESPINFLDTGNNYGDAERRIGIVLRELGGVPDGFVLQTKVDRDMETGDFSGDRVRRSVERSQERLGLDRLGLVHLHDPENISFEGGRPRRPVGGDACAAGGGRDRASRRGRRPDRPAAALHPHRRFLGRAHAQHAPWRIQLSDDIRRRFTPDIPPAMSASPTPPHNPACPPDHPQPDPPRRPRRTPPKANAEDSTSNSTLKNKACCRHHRPAIHRDSAPIIEQEHSADLRQ